MNTATKDKLEIRTSSQELFQDVINSVPLLPEITKLTFLADGINYSEFNGKKGIERYFSECSEKKIIPFSGIELRNPHSVGIFEPYIYAGRLIQISEHLREYMKEAVESLVGGGRIHKISLDIGSGDHGKIGFEEFRKSLFNKLIEQGYQINRESLWLKTGHPGYSFDTGLFGIIEKGLELQIGDEISKEDNKKLTGWFNQLKEKYQSHQLSFL